MTQDNKRLFVLLVIVINLVICVAVQACDFVIFYTFSYLCNSSSFSFYHLGLEIDLEQRGRFFVPMTKAKAIQYTALDITLQAKTDKQRINTQTPKKKLFKQYSLSCEACVIAN